jgi:3-hydroxyphenylacetate 6-hydroxylase
MTSFFTHLVHTSIQTHPFLTLSLLLLFLPLTYILFNEATRRSRRLADFPGPRNWPLVGNIPDIKSNAAEKYREWSTVHGPVYQIQLGNEPVVVVNSADAARKIFGGNSQALSSRPVFWTFHKVSDGIVPMVSKDEGKRRECGATTSHFQWDTV